MPRNDKTFDVRKEFPGDEALQQIHLARRTVQAAVKRKNVTLGQYVRSLKFGPRSSARG